MAAVVRVMVPSGRRFAVDTLFFSAGALAFATQTLLLRELMASLQGDETAVGLGLAAWLAGIAVGAAAARRAVRRWPQILSVASVAALAALLVPAILAARLAARWAVAASGAPAPLGASLVVAAVVMVPPGALVGLGFATLAATARRAGIGASEVVGRLYVLEALGSLAGGLAATFVVIPLLSPLHGAALIGALGLLGAMPAARGRLVPGRLVLPLIALAIVLTGLPPFSSRLESFSESARFGAWAPGIPLLEARGTRYQHLAIAGDPSAFHVYLGGRYAGSAPDPEAEEEEARVVACLAPRPERVLLLGRTLPGIVRFLLDDPWVRRIDRVSLDGEASRSVERHLPDADRAALADPRVRSFDEDPRRFLSAAAERYGLVLADASDPVTLLAARNTTEEFFALILSRLETDGAVVIRSPTPPNALEGPSVPAAAAVFGAARRVFPVVRAAPGPDGRIVAGWREPPVTMDPALLAERFRSRGYRPGVLVPSSFETLFPRDRVEDHERGMAAASSRVPASRDDRPAVLVRAVIHRQSVAGGPWGRWLSAVASRPAYFFGALLAPSAALLAIAALKPRAVRRLPSFTAVHAVAVAGACAMTWSLVLLYAYQTLDGALFGRVGALTALFMLGLAVGGRAGMVESAAEVRVALLRLAAAQGAALVFAAALPGALQGLSRIPASGGIVAVLLLGGLLVLAGMASGAVFPLAAGVLIAAGEGAGAAAARVEAADHAGAAVAAVLAAVLLIPILGLVAAGWLLAGLQALALGATLLMTLERTRRPAP